MAEGYLKVMSRRPCGTMRGLTIDHFAESSA
jgi:hypothetical protein